MKKLIALLALAGIGGSALSQTRIIVRLNPGVDPQSLTQVYPVTLVDFTRSAPFALYAPLPGNSSDVIESDMRAGGLVQFAEDDLLTEAPENQGAGKGGTIAAVFDPNALFNENKDMLAQIHYSFRPLSIFDRPVRVAVLDTGLPFKNVYLGTRVVAGLAVAADRSDFYDKPSGVDTNKDGVPNGALGHGSMVTGLVTELAPFAQLVVARVADADGIASSWNVIKGLAFACTKGAEVVNISLGSLHNIKALKDVIEGWVDPQGVLIVAPVGNNGWKDANQPAIYSQVVCVTGVDPFDVRAPFSNWDGHAAQAAPATGIKSTWWDRTMGIWSGTSFAAPLVAATVADAMRSRPRLNNTVQLDSLRFVLSSVGDNIDAKNPGFGGKLGLRLNCQHLEQAVIGM